MVTLKEGDKAPAFAGKDQNGKKISCPITKAKNSPCTSIRKQTHLPALLNRAIFVITILYLKKMDLK